MPAPLLVIALCVVALLIDVAVLTRKLKERPVMPLIFEDIIEARADADLRARALLDSVLSDDERAEYAKWGTITITGASGNVYRLADYGVAAYEPGTRFRDDGQAMDAFGFAALGRSGCIISRSRGYPTADVLAAKVLLLRHDEAHFIRTTCW